jgi:hypothetical protein
MFRCLVLVALAMACFGFRAFPDEDEGPPISITSPDVGTTFVYGTIKNHQLVWNKVQKILLARVTFIDTETNEGQPTEDVHEFRLPGVNLDEAKGVFFAQSARGEIIPIAHYKKTLFVKSIETLPNARVRIIRDHGNITVILEAISPNDPAMHPPPESSDPDGTHQVDIKSILN